MFVDDDGTLRAAFTAMPIMNLVANEPGGELVAHHGGPDCDCRFTLEQPGPAKLNHQPHKSK
jgi:hypothetical protein